MSTPVLWLEPVGGIAGDMFLAAALDLGVSLEALEAPLRTLGVTGWRFEVTKQERHHLRGTHVDVVVEDGADGHVHRHWTEIDALIGASGLSVKAKSRARSIFRAIGEVEAEIHGVSMEALHFHEVGAVDSIVDICGAAVALELMGEPEVFCAPPPLGSGTVRIAHGVVPVPVPATLALMKGLPARFEGVGELTTPTGAALVKVLTKVEAAPMMVVERIGYGLGTKDFKDRANVLRASLGKRVVAAAVEPLVVLECNLDDLSPQLLSHAAEQLFEAGALDVWQTPIVMKKGRSATLLSVLCQPERRAALVQVMMRETSTLGVRVSAVERHALERQFETVATKYGPIRIKVGQEGSSMVNAAPEFDDVRAAAQQVKVPVKEVWAEAIAVWRARSSR